MLCPAFVLTYKTIHRNGKMTNISDESVASSTCIDVACNVYTTFDKALNFPSEGVLRCTQNNPKNWEMTNIFVESVESLHVT